VVDCYEALCVNTGPNEVVTSGNRGSGIGCKMSDCRRGVDPPKNEDVEEGSKLMIVPNFTTLVAKLKFKV